MRWTKIVSGWFAAGLALLLLAACTTPDQPAESPETAVAEATLTPTTIPDLGDSMAIMTLTPTATSTSLVPTVSPTPPATDTPVPTIEPTPTAITNTPSATDEEDAATDPGSTTGLTITHTDIDRFHDIPDEYIVAASELSWLFRHASVGGNIFDGLECLMNNFERRPHRCDRDLAADEIFYDPKYDYRHWQFEFHSPAPNPNPGWWNKVGFFIDRVHELQPGEAAYISFKVGYVDGGEFTEIHEEFFDPDSSFPNIADLEALQADHPDKTMVWWTMGLARAVGSHPSESFNDQLRAYVAAHNGILMDIADIMSHTPDGEPCYDNADRGITALCAEYTDEVDAGHLNATGRLRMAKAVWILMARLAGWEG